MESNYSSSKKNHCTWEVVDVPPVQQEVAIHRVTKRGHVPRQRHTGTHVAPQTASTVNTHLGLCDVCGHTEIGDPKVLRKGGEGREEGGREGEDRDQEGK